jgi:hypothetical protein
MFPKYSFLRHNEANRHLATGSNKFLASALLHLWLRLPDAETIVGTNYILLFGELPVTRFEVQYKLHGTLDLLDRTTSCDGA